MNDNDGIQKEEEEGEEEVVFFNDDEGFLICLLFHIRVGAVQQKFNAMMQHTYAFDVLWHEIGERGRTEFSEKISNLAANLGYPERAKELVQQYVEEEAKAREAHEATLDEKDLPDPRPGFHEA